MKMKFALIPAMVLAAVSAQAQGQTNPPAAAGAASPAAPAGSAALPTRIGLINVRDAIMSTADGKKAALDLDEQFAARRTGLQKRQIDLQAKRDQLSRGGTTMSDNAKATLAREIEADDKNFKRDVEDLNTDGEEAQNKLFQVIWSKLQPVVQQYALANGFAAILDVGNDQTPVLWASNTMFITTEIVNLYNQSHAPAEGAAGAAAKPAAAGAAAKPATPVAAPAKPPAPPAAKK